MRPVLVLGPVIDTFPLHWSVKEQDATAKQQQTTCADQRNRAMERDQRCQETAKVSRWMLTTSGAVLKLQVG